MKHCQTLAVKSNIYRKGRVKQKWVRHHETPGHLIKQPDVLSLSIRI